MTLGAMVLVLGRVHLVNMQYFFFCNCLHWGMDKIKYVLMMAMKGSPTIVNFMTRRAVVLMLGRGRVIL